MEIESLFRITQKLINNIVYLLVRHIVQELPLKIQTVNNNEFI